MAPTGTGSAGCAHYYLAVEHGLVQGALDALRQAGVDYSVRKGPNRDQDLPYGGEIDLMIRRPDLGRAADALARAGFRYLKAAGHPYHRFYLGFARGAWLKVDVKLDATTGISGPGARWLTSVARRRPLGLRRLGPVVALLGPDGAGKGSVTHELRTRIPVAVAIVYMGAPRPSEPGPAPEGPRPRSAREIAFIVRRLLRAWRLLVRAYATAWRGNIVICDRHPIEVLAVRPQRSPWATRLERTLFAHLVPRPDQIVLLDAPAEVLLARKGEHSVDQLEQWRRRYAEEFLPHGATVVSSGGPLSETVAATSEIVWNQLSIRRQW